MLKGNAAGEDTLLRCPQCAYTANEELATTAAPDVAAFLDEDDCQACIAEVPGHNKLAVIIMPSNYTVNMVKLAKFDPPAKLAALNKPLDSWDGLKILVDRHCASLDHVSIQSMVENVLEGNATHSIWPAPPDYIVGDVVVARAGDRCPKCREALQADKSIEVGHTFLLGDRYSAALDTTFARTSKGTQERGLFQMGCFGIGISRLLGAVAEVTSDSKGLLWPASIAPYSVCILPASDGYMETALAIASELALHCDVIVDDRFQTSFGTRMKDAELVGYPYLAVIGKQWTKDAKVELQYRASGNKDMLDPGELRQHILA